MSPPTHSRGPAWQTVLRQQATSNANSVKHASYFAGHRARFTDLVASAAPASRTGRLVLLGAGDSHDLDLAKLAAGYAEIHLVDLDVAAIERASVRQPEAIRPQISMHAPVDLSGVIALMDDWKARRPTLAELDGAVAPAVADIVNAVPGPFDVTVSCCLATQLIFGLTAVLGEKHPMLAEIRRRVQTIHLRSLAALTRLGGAVLLVSDVCSSDTYPLDELPADANLLDIAAELSRTGNVFFGSDPVVTSQILRKDPELAAHATHVRQLDPWLWHNGPARVFLVRGFAFDRA